jgi:DNA adenine methylase
MQCIVGYGREVSRGGVRVGQFPGCGGRNHQLTDVVAMRDWTFLAQDFRETLRQAGPEDFVYADPPYAGRHVDYFNSWSDTDEADLAGLLKALPCGFILSTWHGNEFRTNATTGRNWKCPVIHVLTREHSYHVGSSARKYFAVP